MKLETADSNPTNDLRGYLDVVRRRKWSIGLIALLVTGGALLASLRQTPLYDSTAKVQVAPYDPGQALSGAADYVFLQGMPNEAAMASTPQVGALASTLVRKQGGNGIETGHLSVSNPANTTILDLTYTDASPQAAQIWAQAYAEAYIQQRDARAEAAYRASTAGPQNRLKELQRELASKQDELLSAPVSEKPSVQNDINYLQTQVGVIEAQIAAVPVPYAGATQLIAPAPLPTAPSSPKLVLNAVLGLMVGLVMGLGLAFVRERLDDRTAGKDDLEGEIGAPVLAVVPKAEGWKRHGTAYLVSRDAPMSAASEAYRTARANLQFLGTMDSVKAIVVTSAERGEGKTATTANLAVTLAQSDKRVVAISCDLRRPRLHAFFGMQNAPGLTELLAGQASLGEVARRAEPRSLRVIPAGTIPSNPAELLGSEAMSSLLRDLREVADFVLLDSPPVLAASDALILAGMADGVVVVADAGSTTRPMLALTRQQLEQVGSRIVGGIYNMFDPSKARFPNYTSYRGYYGHPPSTNGDARAQVPESEDGTQRASEENEAQHMRR
jgi:polysaccharide biosynthesis transport protein